MSQVYSFALISESDIAEIQEAANNASLNTKLTYRYTDAGGYKDEGTVIIKGVLTHKDFTQLESLMEGREFFNPEMVGFAALRGLQDEYGEDDEIDHEMHTLQAMELVTDVPTVDVDVPTLIERFKKAAGGYWVSERQLRGF